MLFPHDIWCLIMSYFHSSLRKTYHIDAITELISNKAPAGWNRVRNFYDSYYLYLQCDLYLWQRSPEIQFLKKMSPFYIRRVVKRGSIERDFIEIWENYSKLFPGHHLIRFVRI